MDIKNMQTKVKEGKASKDEIVNILELAIKKIIKLEADNDEMKKDNQFILKEEGSNEGFDINLLR